MAIFVEQSGKLSATTERQSSFQQCSNVVPVQVVYSRVKIVIFNAAVATKPKIEDPWNRHMFATNCEDCKVSWRTQYTVFGMK